MSESKIGAQLGQTKKFSHYRCIKCHRYLVPCTDEKMDLFGLSQQQKQKLREHQCTHFCPRCMKGFQREEQPLSNESENCCYCGEELAFLRYRGMLIKALYCEGCKKIFVAEENGVKKIEKYGEKMAKGEQVSSKIRTAMKNIQD